LDGYPILPGGAALRPSILYFDDEADLLDVFRKTFIRDYDVLTALTLFEARQILSRRPDIIVSDLRMPEISGIDFLREAMRACPGSFRILLTGHGQVADLIGEVASGVVQVFIAKPWEEAGVRGALERAMLIRSRAE
jgi:DNA-binding NtrC family response regulator